MSLDVNTLVKILKNSDDRVFAEAKAQIVAIGDAATPLLRATSEMLITLSTDDGSWMRTGCNALVLGMAPLWWCVASLKEGNYKLGGTLFIALLLYACALTGLKRWHIGSKRRYKRLYDRMFELYDATNTELSLDTLLRIESLFLPTIHKFDLDSALSRITERVRHTASEEYRALSEERRKSIESLLYDNSRYVLDGVDDRAGFPTRDHITDCSLPLCLAIIQLYERVHVVAARKALQEIIDAESSPLNNEARELQKQARISHNALKSAKRRPSEA